MLTRTSVRVLIVLIASLMVTVVVNSLHPAKLPLMLAKGQRPGIPVGSWAEELPYEDIQKVSKLVLAGDAVLIDVRERAEFDGSHASGSVNLPYSEFDSEFDEVYTDFAATVPKEEQLFILCGGMLCGLSERTAKRLMDAGYSKIAIVKQGFEHWEDRGLSVEKGFQEHAEHDAGE